jgi:hypothetical protein
MSKFVVKNTFIIFIFVFLSFTFVSTIKAQACSLGAQKSQDYVTGCNQDPPDCTPKVAHITTPCTTIGNSCIVIQQANSCTLHIDSLGKQSCLYNEGGNNQVNCNSGPGGGGGGGGCSAGYHKETECKKSCAVADREGTCGTALDGSTKYTCKSCVKDPCNATAPTNLTITKVSSNNAKATWVHGSGGVEQRMYFGTNKNQVEGNCTSGCTQINGLGVNVNTVNTGAVLNFNQIYYFRVITFGSASCSADSVTKNYTPTCSATSPTNLSFTKSGSHTILHWTPGTGGTSQQIYYGTNKNQVAGSCAGANCTILPVANAAIQKDLGVLNSQSIYYARVINSEDAACSSSSASKSYLTSCSIAPLTVSVQSGVTSSALEVQVNQSSDITKVDFSSGNTSIATVSPASDTTYKYQATVTGVSTGTTTINANVFVNGASACSSQAGVTVTSVSPAWWQIKDSDLQTNSDVSSKVPAGVYFDLNGPGGFPGVIAYGGSFNKGSGITSTTNWLAQTTHKITKVYDSKFFKNQIPGDTIINDASLLAGLTGTIDPNSGFYWYKYNGTINNLPFTINSNLDIADKKVILIVNEADFNINSNINLTDGRGFFMVLTEQNEDGDKGNIIISPTVTDLEGIYFADNDIPTGTVFPSLDVPLHVRGSVATVHGGVTLQRDLGASTNSTTPGELFEYAPDQILLYPKNLSVRKIRWKEVAP